MPSFSIDKKVPPMGVPTGAKSEGTDASGLSVWTKGGRACRWTWKVGGNGERGSGYKNCDMPEGYDRGHIMSCHEGAKDTRLADSPMNIAPQTVRVNRSNVKRFEAWRVKNAQGATVTCVQPTADGNMRVQVVDKQGQMVVDTTFNPNSPNTFEGDWWLQKGPHN